MYKNESTLVQDHQAPKSGGLGLLATSLDTSTLSPLKPRKVLPLLSWFMDTVLLKVSSSVILMPLPLDSGSSLLTNLGGVDQVDLILRVKAHKKQRRTQDGLARIWKTMLMSRMFSLTWESTSKCRMTIWIVIVLVLLFVLVLCQSFFFHKY
ncbi:uncharacterized protein LOC130494756 isoform X4 [Raphanus sativus]|uniref:Uncharacterized protein LOC108846445 isoform X3 n=2 Tax=Raphanus sativus TaxID=3726 RepID=A0A9W3CQI9_RAPSA|nr:uncharacterized protein LOC108846445 isoform X3 [Raphanus sativus]XP_056853805.1 uncharacterized protein LOC130494756 isoform X4 [Raphanus sativus]